MIHVSVDDLRRQLKNEIARRENSEAMTESLRAENTRLRKATKTHVLVPRPSHLFRGAVAGRASLGARLSEAGRRIRELLLHAWRLAWPEMPHED